MATLGQRIRQIDLMKSLSRGWLTTIWGSAQASASLTAAATGWMVSGITPSPLVNACLPILGLLPLLLPLPRNARGGYGLQLLGLGLLLAIALKLLPGLGVAMAGLLLFGLGRQMSRLALEQHLTGTLALPYDDLRRGREIGQVSGSLLAGLLFPIGQALLQFSQALVLLLPLAPTIGGVNATATTEPPPKLPFCPRSLLQGLLFGALFALLPLWVRQVATGKCLDFGLLLTAYGLGRSGFSLLPALPTPALYGGMAGILALVPVLPGWAAIAGFLPLGALAAQTDGRLVAGMAATTDSERWLRLQRFGALGGLLGSLLIGAIAQGLGLERSLPLLVLAFVAAGPILQMSHD